MKKQGNADYYDLNLIAVIILLMGFGLVMLYSTSAYRAGIRYNNDMYFFTRQARLAVIAIGLAIGVSIVDYHRLYRLSGLIYAGSILLLLMVRFTPLGRTINGARRWIAIGPISFQPAEVSKIAVIVFVPMMIVKAGKKFRGMNAILPPLAAGGIQSLAVYVLTSNLSTAVIIALITCSIIFVAHPDTKKMLLAAFGMVLLAAAVVAYIAVSGGNGGFRSKRILTWLHPEEYSAEGGYQIMQALYALGSGGFFGKGLGNSTQKLGAVPEAENDMIFSIICEELGIFGGVIVVMLFLYLLYRLFFIAQNAPDLYGALMVTGIFTHIAAQVILNICVVTNMIPTTGITLPFVSYGGTSILLLMAEMSIALSVSKRIRFRNTERDLWGEIADPD